MLSPRQSLGRKPEMRRMLLRNLATSLLLYEKIRTTKVRAKALQPLIDRMIAKAKRQPAHIAVRSLNRIVTDKNAARKIFDVLIARYKSRPSGMTRIRPLGIRKGDGAQLVEISLVDSPVAPEHSRTKKKS
ncbi:50S ribosomal protein L17 [Candidatus Kaiserbacteria bacterium RIFCSPLOWO2_12_FULL_53_8]|uniref:50S ribosomal protein L17 n=1 Tax=Candidatus Kaiserbacteria bacterium RIFCSPLOWO2_12_FULL_53_8 TaxID=1798529 RepID=A0A1F6G0E3_9BACT|nr:MAG: 50S ribosomal protein L17 [Candidatus Kaiserbacteria bacterium RIFCSPLOWO2_12_FULL_53_8]